MADQITPRTNRSTGQSVRGMESVVATVSGYHGLERFKLIKLINFTGASYVGAMNKATTHLVCWKFEGRKYELAKSFGTIIVSPRWFEDCVQAGKRLPERHYRMKSGQQVGPLSWEVPVIGDEVNASSRSKCEVLLDLTNRCKVTKTIEKDVDCLRSNSLLLREDSSPAQGTSIMSRKIGKSIVPKSKHVCRSNGKNFMIGESSSESLEAQHEKSSSYSTVSAKLKRNDCSSVENSLNAVPTRKSRRLVKKNASRGVLESSILDNEHENPGILRNEIVDIEQDCSPNDFDSRNIGMGCSTASTNKDCSIVGRNLEDGISSGENMNEVVEDIDGIADINRSHAVNDSSLINGSVLAQDLFSQSPDSEKNMDATQVVDDSLETAMKLPASLELSCVICWTDFSSTRGVLPCGHRFCYSCIQSWADTMASRRKVSTCPLCKASFMSITKVDGGASSDQKIYSQTIPLGSADIYVLPDWDHSSFSAQSSSASVCCECRSREPEDLLIPCHLCSSRLVHTYCLDPPMTPWTCNNCRNLRMMYLRNN